MRRAALIFLLLLGGALAASAATATVSVGGASGQLSFVDSTNGTSTTTITAGDTVLWIWASGMHSTTSGTCDVNGNCTHTGFWDSDVFTFSSSAPPSFSRTFNKPGTYPYFCTVHDNAMTGVVVVRPNFTPAAQYATGRAPITVTLVDVNGDGKLDAITVNNGDNTVSVRLGNGDGTFAATKSDFAVGNAPAAVAVGDFNGDGKLDLAVSNVTDGTVSILVGNGDGTFQAAVPYTVGVNPQAIAVADFNGDGKLDLAVANSGSQNVSILLGNGDGTFIQPAQNFAVGIYPASVVSADFNRDGIPDLAVSNSMDGTISILIGKGDGTFLARQDFAAGSAGSAPKGIAVGDLNGDGILDLAVADDGTTPRVVNILMGKGDGSFQPPVSYPVGAANANPQSLALLDVDGDGNLDIAVSDSASANVHILMGDGQGGFQPAPDLSITPDTGSQFVVTGDINRDGKPDLVTADFNDNKISVLLNRTPGAVLLPATHLAVTSPTTVNAGSGFSVTVRALDDFERVATGYTGSIAFSSSDGSATLPANYTFTSGAGLDNGTHTFNGVILRSAAQLQTIAAADVGTATLRGSSSDITVVPGAATQMLVTAPATATAGAGFSFKVTVKDQFGNIAAGYAGTVAFTSTDQIIGVHLPPDSTLTNGVGNFSAALITAGSQTLFAVDLANSLSSNAPIMVLPGPAAQFKLFRPSVVSVGEPFSITVNVYDNFLNLVTGFQGTVQFSSSDPAAVLPAPYTFVLADAGIHTFTNGFTLNNVGAGLGGMQTITVVAGAASGTTPIFVAPVQTTTVLTVAPDQSVFRQTVTLTATVTSQFGALPVGGVMLSDGGVFFTPIAVPCVQIDAATCQATFSSSQWTIGEHALGALFLHGNPNFQDSVAPNVIFYHAPRPIQRAP
jgi:plastocyanin